MTELQKFMTLGISIFQGWANMLKNATYDGFSLFDVFIIGLFITIIGIIWGFDLD